ncbi:hypothetical protein D3C71_1688960 [compost metagenome]
MWTDIQVALSVILKSPLGDQTFYWSIASTANDGINPPDVEFLADICCVITGIKGDSLQCFIKPKFLYLQFKPLKIRFGVMDISGCNMYISNNIVFMIDRPVIQIEETFRLAVAHHIPAVGIRCAHFRLLGLAHLLPRL